MSDVAKVEPSVLAVGADQFTVTEPAAVAETVMVNVPNGTVTIPSLTEITMPAYVPALVGVPVKAPVVVENDAQVGRFVIVNASVLLSRSEAVGVNEYAAPTCAVVDGVPEIVGARFVPGLAGNVVGAAPSDPPPHADKNTALVRMKAAARSVAETFDSCEFFGEFETGEKSMIGESSRLTRNFVQSSTRSALEHPNAPSHFFKQQHRS